MTLGERIAQHRKALGISQEELGARLGVSRQAVSKWETSAAVPDMENLLALAREFGVPVAELTGTPERVEPSAAGQGRSSKFWKRICAVLAGVLLVLMGVFALNYSTASRSAGDVPIREATEPTAYPATDFALLWTDSDGYEAYLELGTQEEPFPFGRELELTEPEEVQDTDSHLTTLHRADCGAVTVEYLHTEADPERKQAEGDFITALSTIAASVSTPRGIRVGDTRADVTLAYGDDLVYCLKEEESYTLVQHDYYYAYQTLEQPTYALLFFMQDGQVVGIRAESTGDLGLDAYAPNNTSRFPVVDGEPDFSQRQEPERETISDTQRVYIAWNQLVTNDNLSAEERYTYQQTIFSGLAYLDWQELGQLGSTEYPQQTMEALLSWLREQAPYTGSKILSLQMGVQSNLDGWLTDSYASLLSAAFFGDPVTFARNLATDSLEDTMYQVIRLTAYDAELYPAELETALDTLDAALADGTFTEAQQGWAELLRLYLTTPIDQRSSLPRSPEELEA